MITEVTFYSVTNNPVTSSEESSAHVFEYKTQIIHRNTQKTFFRTLLQI